MVVREREGMCEKCDIGCLRAGAILLGYNLVKLHPFYNM
jgi:hypothetical protein